MTRILVVDNYDSFVFTIVGYLEQLGAECEVVRNDAVGLDLGWSTYRIYLCLLIRTCLVANRSVAHPETSPKNCFFGEQRKSASC